MKENHSENFIFGFLIAAVAVIGLYWLLRQNREVAPKPLIIRRQSPPQQISNNAAEKRTKQDKLTNLQGIGPVSEKRLNEAGIFSYAQLAEKSPEELEAITGTTRWDPADWINEAKKLSSN